VDGVFGVFNNLVDNFQKAHNQARQEKIKEIASWSPSKLRDEMQVVQELIQARIDANVLEPGQAAGEVEQVYQEAMESGDRYKQRAAAEIARGSLAKVPNAPTEVRMLFNTLGKQAQRDLEGIRQTPEMLKAEEKARDLFDKVQNKANEMDDVEKVIGISQAIFRAKRRVKIDPDTREITILPKDDPRVTGIYFPSRNGDEND
jgi:hypothetical protein